MLLGLVVSVGVLAGCARPPIAGNVIGIGNATSVPVALHVDGTWLGTYPAWAESVAAFPIGPDDSPRRVEFLTADGSTIASFIVAHEEGEPRGTSARWNTSCGVFVAWFRDRPGDAPEIDPAAARPPGPPCR